MAHNRGKGFWVERNDEWVRTERTSAFQELTRSKKAFIIPATIFFLVFYFGLPFLAALLQRAVRFSKPPSRNRGFALGELLG